MSEPRNVDRHLVVDRDLVELRSRGGRFRHGARHALFVAELLARDLVRYYHPRMVLTTVRVTRKRDNVLKD